MVHKRYRDPSMGYDRRNAREEERAVIEEQLQDASDMAAVLGLGEPAGASNALAERMSAAASELRNNDLKAEVARDAVADLDMDSLVGGAAAQSAMASEANAGFAFGAASTPEPQQPSAGQQAEALFDGMKVETPKVTQVNRGESTRGRAAKSDGLLSKLMRMLRG